MGNDDKVVVQSGGIGVTGLLGVVFIVLKLIGVINWSWWWVMSPFWIPIVLVLGTVLIIVIIIAIVAGITD